MIETHNKTICRCCGGSGVQTRNDGVKITCPACGGTGFTYVSNMAGLPPGIYCSTNGGVQEIQGSQTPINTSRRVFELMPPSDGQIAME